MILFVLGYICGFLAATFLAVMVIMFRSQVERAVEITEQKIEGFAPKQKGYIIEATDPINDLREEILEENSKRGIDTPLKDLQ